MIDIDIHICVQLLVYFNPTKAKKNKRIVKNKSSAVYKLNTKLCKYQYMRKLPSSSR